MWDCKEKRHFFKAQGEALMRRTVARYKAGSDNARSFSKCLILFSSAGWPLAGVFSTLFSRIFWETFGNFEKLWILLPTFWSKNAASCLVAIILDWQLNLDIFRMDKERSATLEAGRRKVSWIDFDQLKKFAKSFNFAWCRLASAKEKIPACIQSNAQSKG